MSRRRAGTGNAPQSFEAPAPVVAPTRHLVRELSQKTPSNGLHHSASPMILPTPAHISIWIRWAVVPTAALKVLAVPVALSIGWELLSALVAPGLSNPFTPFFLLSGSLEHFPSNDPRYRKTYWDLVFVAYYVVFFSLVREVITTILAKRVAKYFGLRKPAKVVRFGEQLYSLLYHATLSVWGCSVMSQLPTFWFRTEHFWIDYPFWELRPNQKRYYLTHAAFWCQQLLVMVLGLEKPRKDYWEFVAHHVVTIWLIGWSYLVNMTPMGNAVYLSMDIPDALFSFSKLLNYIQWNTAKTWSFAVFIVAWTYFRHYLNLTMQVSSITEFHLLPPETQQWNPQTGAWMAWWMKWQIFGPMTILQCLNLFWYYFIVRVLVRALRSSDLDDDRSDDEGEGDEDLSKKDD